MRAQDPGAPVSDDAEAAVRAVMVEERRAAGRCDVEALYAHVLDGAVPPIIENGRVAPTRSAALERTTRAFTGLTSASYAYSRENITQVDANTVLWVGAGTASATLADGRAITAPFAETVVFVRREEGWKILHAHRSAPD